MTNQTLIPVKVARLEMERSQLGKLNIKWRDIVVRLEMERNQLGKLDNRYEENVARIKIEMSRNGDFHVHAHRSKIVGEKE